MDTQQKHTTSWSSASLASRSSSSSDNFPLASTILRLLALPPEDRTTDQMVVHKRAYAKANKLPNVPTNMQLFQTYRMMVAAWTIEETSWLEDILKKRSVRSASGIVPIQVLTKPFWCPGKCIFCPNDATMPKSYINTQPGAMRALLNQFDPYKQVYNRLLSLTLTGHPTDKIEMIVLGGTWDVYPEKYKTRFVKGLYDACNTFPEFLRSIDIDFSAGKAARYTPTDDLTLEYPDHIDESLRLNEYAAQRIIGLTVETRPEYVTDKNCQYWRSLGITRMEMWIQSLDDGVLDANKRGHGTSEIFAAMHKLKQYGFKISTHIMPGLYQSTYEKDKETFSIAYSSPRVKPDEIKFYPTAVIPNTELYDLYKSWAYTPLEDDNLKRLIYEVKTEIIPPYTRIKRLARDFDTNEVVAWANTPNLRQLVMQEMHHEMSTNIDKSRQQYARLAPDATCVDSLDDVLALFAVPFHSVAVSSVSSGGLSYDADASFETVILGDGFDESSPREFVCLCTRCREVRHMANAERADTPQDSDAQFFVLRRYRSSVGEELFISCEDSKWYLYGFTRLLLPDRWSTIDREWLGQDTALIRELHVYGKLARLHKHSDTTTQHQGIGSRLMHIAEEVARCRWYDRLSVISGIWVRWYYAHLWYHLAWTYMVRSLR